jgi:hypothetical protein
LKLNAIYKVRNKFLKNDYRYASRYNFRKLNRYQFLKSLPLYSFNEFKNCKMVGEEEIRIDINFLDKRPI